MRALIVDDEAPARMALRRALSGVPEIEIVGEAADGVEALEQAEELAAEVVFLDIEMPGLNGLEVAAGLPAGVAVVFVTAYDQYAVKAFEANAVDYLLKPLDAAAVQRTIPRLVARRQAGTAVDTGILRELRMALLPAGATRLAARRGRKVVLIARRDIRYIEAEERLVYLHTISDKVLSDRTVQELEGMLPDSEFVRINRGVLVNLEYVEELYPWMQAGAWRVRMRGGGELDVSRERVKVLRKMLGF